MSKHDFSLEEFQDRQRRVREAMEKAGIDLLLVLNPVNVNYLIGCRVKGWQELHMLFFTLEPGPLTILSRLAEAAEIADLSLAEDVHGWGGREPEDPIDVVKSTMVKKGYLNRRVGLEVPQHYLHPYHYVALKEMLGDSLVLETTDFIDNLKFVKSPAEIAYIRKAAGILDEGMKTCVQTLAEGKTELEVAAEMHRTMMALGSDAPPSPMNFASGERTAYGHGMPSERRIHRGDLIHMEYGASYRRYCSTIGRVLCMGRPTPRMKEVYNVVREACDEMIAAVKPGVSAVAPHEASKKVIENAGMNEGRWHLSGYGIAPGFPPVWGEVLKLEAGSPYTLEPGMIISIEPPVFLPQERIGFRIIDNVLITDSGAEILSKFPRDFIGV